MSLASELRAMRMRIAERRRAKSIYTDDEIERVVLRAMRGSRPVPLWVRALRKRGQRIDLRRGA